MTSEHLHNYVRGLEIVDDECNEGGDVLGIGGYPVEKPEPGDICDICGHVFGQPEGTQRKDWETAMYQLRKLPQQSQ